MNKTKTLTSSRKPSRPCQNDKDNGLLGHLERIRDGRTEKTIQRKRWTEYVEESTI